MKPAGNWLRGAAVAALVVASSVAAGILAAQQDPSPHPWVASADDPARVDATLRVHAAKLPPGAQARFDHATDGLLRAVVTVHDRAAAQTLVDSHVTARTWLGDSPRLIAAVTPEQLADLLESPHVQSVEPDFPIRFLSSESTLASHARSPHDGTSGQGTGVWTYNATSGELESDGPWKKYTGNGTTIAIIDSGIDRTHPDFYEWGCQPNMIEGTSMVDTDSPGCESRIKAAVKVAPLVGGAADLVQVVDDALPTTDHGALGHGTHVAGIVAGNAHASNRTNPDNTTYGGDGLVFGVAPQANIVSVAIGDTEHAWQQQTTQGAWYSMAVAAMQWTLDHAEEYDIRVVLNAWICNPDGTNTACSGNQGADINRITEDMYDARIVVVFAVGEEHSVTSNGRDSWNKHAVAVGAYDGEDDVASFSGSCPNNCPALQDDPEEWSLDKETTTRQGPDLLAPGVGIWAARTLAGTPVGQGTELTPNTDDDAGQPRTHDTPAYDQLSGTSMAAAHVAGAAALLVEACPSAGPLDVMRALFMGANRTLFDTHDHKVHGYGALGVRASLDWFLENALGCQTSLPPKITQPEWKSLGVVPFHGDSIAFTAEVDDEDGKVVRWRWDFGDGNSEDGEGPEGVTNVTTSHAYTKAGDYIVNLTIVDDAGARDFSSLPVRVFEKPAMQPSPPIRIDVNCIGLPEDVTCPGGVIGIQNLTGDALGGNGTEGNPFVLENLEIVVEAVYNDDLSVHAYEPTTTTNSNERGLDVVGIEVVDTGTHYVLIQNVSIHTSHSTDPHPDDVGVNRYGLRIGSDVDGKVRVENVFMCGTQERPLRFGLEIRGDNNDFSNITVCHTTRTGLEFAAAASDNKLRDCYIWETQDASIGGNGKNNNDINTTTCPHLLKLPDVDSITANFTIQTPGVVNITAGHEVAVVGDEATLLDASTTPGSIPIKWEWTVEEAGEEEKIVVTNHEEPAKHVFGDTVNCADVTQDSDFGRVTLNVTDHTHREEKDQRHGEVTKKVCVTHRPVADFEFVTAGWNVLVDARCAAGGACASDADGDALSYEWRFLRDGQDATGTYRKGSSSQDAARFVFEGGGDVVVELRVMDPYGAVAVKTEHLQLVDDIEIAPPIAGFDVHFQGTTSRPVVLLDESEDLNGDPLVEWGWEFGDGNRLDVVVPEDGSLDPCPEELALPEGVSSWMCQDSERQRFVLHRYARGGTYDVNMSVMDDDTGPSGGWSEFPATGPVTVANTLPTPAFVVASGSDAIQSIEDVVFDASASRDYDGSVEGYWWDVDGDGVPESVEDVFTFNFTQNNLPSGTYHVNLTVTDDEEGVNWTVQPVVVENTPPAAGFTWDCDCPGGPTTAHDIEFVDASQDRDFGSISGWSWDFGDGNASSEINPTHRFSRPGRYEVNLTVRDNDGAPGWRVEEVVVANALPSAAFSSSPGEPTVLDTITFTSLSSDEGSIVSASWDFGDGNASSGDVVEHNYAWPGTYTVALTVTDDADDESTFEAPVVVRHAPPAAGFAATPWEATTADVVAFTDASTNPDERFAVAAWAWDFGDGNASSETHPTHRFADDGAYDVRLTVTNEVGRTHAVTHRVTVGNLSPAAHPTASPEVPSLDEEVRFEANATDSDGHVIAYRWDFGDGAAASGPVVHHAYQQKGAHVVRLVVTDDDGATAEARIVVRVGNIAPTTSFTHAPAQPSTSDAVRFEASTHDEDGTIVSWSWDFGDGETSTRRSPTHAYARAGTYAVSLAVTDSDGDTTRAHGNVTVTNSPPGVDFDHHPAEPTTRDLVRFAGTASDPDGTIVSWSWDFGDGNASSRDAPEHRFGRAGSYVVRLAVTDDEGVERSAQHVVRVRNVPPAAEIQVQPRGEADFSLRDASRDGDGAVVARHWDLGDGTTAQGEEVEHSYAEPGAYVVTLTVQDDGGGEATTFVTVVAEGPPPSFLAPGEDREVPLSPLAAAAGLAAALALRRRRGA